MKARTKHLIELKEDEYFSDKPGERGFYSTGIDPWRIFITYQEHGIESISIQNGKSWVHLNDDDTLTLSDDEGTWDLTTTVEDVREAHQVKRALRTICKAVR